MDQKTLKFGPENTQVCTLCRCAYMPCGANTTQASAAQNRTDRGAERDWNKEEERQRWYSWQQNQLLPPFQIISHSKNFGESNHFKV